MDDGGGAALDTRLKKISSNYSVVVSKVYAPVPVSLLAKLYSILKLLTLSRFNIF